MRAVLHLLVFADGVVYNGMWRCSSNGVGTELRLSAAMCVCVCRFAS